MPRGVREDRFGVRLLWVLCLAKTLCRLYSGNLAISQVALRLLLISGEGRMHAPKPIGCAPRPGH